MAYPNPDIGDIVATTIESRSKKAADNITRRERFAGRHRSSISRRAEAIIGSLEDAVHHRDRSRNQCTAHAARRFQIRR